MRDSGNAFERKWGGIGDFSLFFWFIPIISIPVLTILRGPEQELLRDKGILPSWRFPLTLTWLKWAARLQEHPAKCLFSLPPPSCLLSGRLCPQTRLLGSYSPQDNAWSTAKSLPTTMIPDKFREPRPSLTPTWTSTFCSPVWCQRESKPDISDHLRNQEKPNICFCSSIFQSIHTVLTVIITRRVRNTVAMGEKRKGAGR